jgi:hypothetical protein
MRLRDLYQARGLAGAAALFGLLLYTALIPIHIVSQAKSGVVAGARTAYGDPTDGGCHAATDSKSPTPGAPNAPQKKCPFCMGYASFVSAITGAASACIAAIKIAPATSRKSDEASVEGVVRRPQNRGPPLLLV